MISLTEMFRYHPNLGKNRDEIGVTGPPGDDMKMEVAFDPRPGHHPQVEADVEAIAGAGLDVFEEEPAINPGFKALKNVIMSPHIASSSEQTRFKMAMDSRTLFKRSSVSAGVRSSSPGIWRRGETSRWPLI